MQGYVEVWVSLTKSLRGRSGREFVALADSLDKFWTKRISRNVYDYYYTIPDNSEQLKELLSFTQENRNLVDICWQSTTAEYSEQELINAKAFIPTLNNSRFNEYDDVEAVSEKCTVCGGKQYFKESVLWDGKSYGETRVVKPDGKLKSTDRTFIVRDDYDPMILLVSNGMHNSLRQRGYEESCFRPAQTKRGKIIAHEMIPSEILPSGCFQSDRFKSVGRCEACGNISYTEQEVFKYEPLSLKGIDHLPADICHTSDYYDGMRILLISPQLRNDIVSLDKHAEFLPVF